MTTSFDRVNLPKQRYPDTSGNLDYSDVPNNGWVEGTLQELVTTSGAVASVTLDQTLPSFCVVTHWGVAMITSPGDDPLAGTAITIGTAGDVDAIMGDILEAEINVAGEMTFGAAIAATSRFGMDGTATSVQITGTGGNIDTGVTFVVKLWYRKFAPFSLA